MIDPSQNRRFQTEAAMSFPYFPIISPYVCACGHLSLLRTVRFATPSLYHKLLSIVKLDVSGDMSYATVYVSAIEGKEKTAQSVKALKGAAGYIRRELGQRLKLRKVPELRFIADDSIEISANISRIVNSFDGGNNDGE